MSRLIIVCGLPGTGKSTFAASLSAAMDAIHLNTDKVRSDLDRRGHYSREDKALIYDILLQTTREKVKNGELVVLDGTFYRQALRKPFIALAEELNAQVHWFEVIASEAVVRERVARQRPYTEADFQVYRKIKDAYDPLVIPHLVLDSELLSPAEMVSTAMEYLKNR